MINLDYISGRLGVGGSNPLAPTNKSPANAGLFAFPGFGHRGTELEQISANMRKCREIVPTLPDGSPGVPAIGEHGMPAPCSVQCTSSQRDGDWASRLQPRLELDAILKLARASLRQNEWLLGFLETAGRDHHQNHPKCRPPTFARTQDLVFRHRLL
jgi:hypothetical protein